MSRASRTATLLLAFALVATLAGCSGTGGRNAANPPDTTADAGLEPDTTSEPSPRPPTPPSPRNWTCRWATPPNSPTASG